MPHLYLAHRHHILLTTLPALPTFSPRRFRRGDIIAPPIFLTSVVSSTRIDATIAENIDARAIICIVRQALRTCATAFGEVRADAGGEDMGGEGPHKR